MPRKKKTPVTDPVSLGSDPPHGIAGWLGDTPLPHDLVVRTLPTDRPSEETAAPTIWNDAVWTGVQLASPSPTETLIGHMSTDVTPRVENRMQAKHRWIREGRLEDVERWMQEKRSAFRDTGLARHRANDMAWDAAIAHFPPPGQEPMEAPKAQQPALLPEANSAKGDTLSSSLSAAVNGAPSRVVEQAPADQVQGMGQIPAEWPTLPDNASLQAELGWVQSQRLRIVEERGNVTTVHLERASSPPPSWSALGWLETSIRSYAKYVDIVAKSLSVVQDEQDSVRRERLRLAEIGQLLDEMHRDEEGRR